MPTISRPLLIVLIAAVLALVGFYATAGSRQASDSGSAPVPAAQPESAPRADASKPAEAAKPKPRAERAQPKAKDQAGERPLQVAKAERQAPAKRKAKARAATSGPAAVNRAIRGDKTVVLYFYGPESADDSATGRAVASVKGKHVVVFKAPIGKLTAYRDLIGQLGIAQAPAVVIVGRGRSARVVEGYVDASTLRQDVADAR